jgi:putative oxidoreductase
VETDDIFALIGRLFMAFLFLASAFGKITNFDGTVGYMETHGVPAAILLCAAAAAVEALGGISLALGFQARWAAAALAGYVVVASLMFHTSPDQRIHLLKNFAVIGGLLQIAAFGSGGLSLEGRRRSA